MIATQKAWDRLVREVKKLKGFQDVRAYPFHRMNDAAFLKDFPGLQLPACLIVFLGRTRTIKGAARDDVNRWSAIIIDTDSGGEAWQTVDDLVDDFQNTVLDQQLLDDELTVYGSSDVAVAPTSPRYAVYEVAITTREAQER